MSLGSFICLGGILDLILWPFGWYPGEITIGLACVIVAGIISTIICGKLIWKYRMYKKLIMIV